MGSWDNTGRLPLTSAAGASLPGLWSQGNHSQTQLGLQSDHKWGALGLVTRLHLAFKQLFSCDCASGNKLAAHAFQNSAISCDSINHTDFLSNPAWANTLILTQRYCPDAHDQGFPQDQIRIPHCIAMKHIWKTWGDISHPSFTRVEEDEILTSALVLTFLLGTLRQQFSVTSVADNMTVQNRTNNNLKYLKMTIRRVENLSWERH